MGETLQKLNDLKAFKSQKSLNMFLQSAGLTGEERMYKGLSKDNKKAVTGQ